MDTQAADLLDAFGRIKGRTNRPQTFMEIAGYPHYENACSNFLAFFFDPEGPHGLGNLFLHSLMDSVGAAGAEEGGFGGNVSVEREVRTAEGNRIDILITSDSRAVLIENKIFAAVANPFEDYSEHMDRLKNADGDAYGDRTKILLTLQPSGEGAEWGFVNLTHAEFAGAVRSALGHHVSAADTRHLTLMLDFLNTLENLGERTRMNEGFVELLGNREEEVNEFLQGIKEMRDEMRGKARGLGELIDVGEYPNVVQGDWRPTVELYHALYHDVYTDEKRRIGIDTLVSPSGWEINIFPRPGTTRREVEDLLEELGIEFENDWRCIYPQGFDYGEDLDRIVPVVREIVGKIADAVR